MGYDIPASPKSQDFERLVAFLLISGSLDLGSVSRIYTSNRLNPKSMFKEVFHLYVGPQLGHPTRTGLLCYFHPHRSNKSTCPPDILSFSIACNPILPPHSNNPISTHHAHCEAGDALGLASANAPAAMTGALLRGALG